jgi:copper oxidase (laccase) domain-containing protein
MVADCIPLLLKSDIAVAAVHVGRKGLMNGVARKTIDAMRDLGAEVIHSYIGPNICGGCYEVGEEIYSEVIAKYPSSDSKTRTGKYTLDLVAGLKTDLKDTVLLDLSSCVLEDKNSFSYRRDGITGRQAGVIWL